MDRLTPEQRSAVMAKVRGKNTKPEIRVRSLLHLLGYRFRLHRKDLPGKPDIVLPSRRIALFVHGCFWHRHPGCSRSSVPVANTAFWEAKFKANVERDRRNAEDLEKAGWRVAVIWECQTKDLAVLSDLLKGLLGEVSS